MHQKIEHTKIQACCKNSQYLQVCKYLLFLTLIFQKLKHKAVSKSRFNALQLMNVEKFQSLMCKVA